MSEQDSDPFVTRTRKLLDESTEHLDAATLSKLRRARIKAIEGKARDRSWFYWAPAGALTAGFLMYGIVLNQPPAPAPVDVIYQDSFQLETVENLELLNDLEFVAWLVLEENV